MRELHIGSEGADVKLLQASLNDRSAPRGFPVVVVDGDLGEQTKIACERVGRALGALEETLQRDHVSIGLQRIIINPRSRTPRQLVRARSRASQAKAQAKRAAKAKAVVLGNRVTGGSSASRRVAAARKALELDNSGARKSFYSQPGKFSATHTITGEKPGERSDCSQHVTGLHWSAGDHDPNGEDFKAGYTGTLANNMREIDHAIDGCTVIWDAYGPQGHTALMEDAKKGLCIGHGSRHVARHNVRDFAYKGRPRYYVPAL